MDNESIFKYSFLILFVATFAMFPTFGFSILSLAVLLLGGLLVLLPIGWTIRRRNKRIIEQTQSVEHTLLAEKCEAIKKEIGLLKDENEKLREEVRALRENP